MSLINHVTTRHEYDVVAWLVRESTVRGLGWAFGQFYRNDGGVSTPSDLRHFGNLAEEIRRSGMNEERRGKHLQKLAVCVAHQLGVRSSNGNHPDKSMIDDLFEVGARREYRHQGYHVAELEESGVFINTIHALMIPLAAGVTPEEIDENPQTAAEVVHEITLGTGQPVAVQKAKQTICAVRRWGSVRDWVSPAAVQRLRETMGSGHTWAITGALRGSSNSTLNAFHAYVRCLNQPRRARRAS